MSHFFQERIPGLDFHFQPVDFTPKRVFGLNFLPIDLAERQSERIGKA